MVKNIIYIIIVAVIGIPSWQIGTVMLEKKKVTYLIQEQANKIKKYDNEDLVKNYLKENLELMNLPTEFSFKMLERRKVKIGYTYYGAATIFDYTYYETTVDIEAVTKEGSY
ncbi:MAG: hypothetical protein WBM35_00840 [Candidatus Electrothrix sp.]